MSKVMSVSYELLWWAFTLVLAGLVLLPVYTTLPEFPYFTANFVYVVVAITLTRYLFFLNISWLRDRFVLQAALCLALFPLVFWMGQYFNYFITFFDEQGPDVLTRNLDRDTAGVIDDYLHAEYRLFGTWAIVAAAVTPPRMLYNVWVRYKQKNRK